VAPASVQGEASLHGNAPDSCEIALLLVDLINDLEFPGGERLAARARSVARNVAEIKARALRAGIPCIYANDNFGRWRSDFSTQVRHCLDDGVRGRILAAALPPRPEDYFVLKPKHSAFYQTCLEVLLQHLGTKVIVLAGISTESCVALTASDAYLRGHRLIVLSDGCAAIDAKGHREALSHMARALQARLTRCRDLRFVVTRGQPRLRFLPSSRR
jgi:nicotinamidase-related amidase